MTISTTVKVFAILGAVRRRRHDFLRYRVTLYSRGDRTVMYRSKLCDTKDEAIHLAKTYLRRHSGRLVDTTLLGRCSGWDSSG
jgi:hypothetical protein